MFKINTKSINGGENMNTHNEFTSNCEPSAVALGYFDGIHRGHQKVISKAVSLKKYGLKPTVFTFSQNPKSVISGTPENRITNNKEKETEIQKLGIEELYIVNFENIKNMTSIEFVEDLLYKKLNAHAVVCGFNYHFGKGGHSNAEDLKKIFKNYNIKTYIIKPVLYKSKPISSTRIREALKQNDVSKVTDMMKGKNLKYNKFSA